MRQPPRDVSPYRGETGASEASGGVEGRGILARRLTSLLYVGLAVGMPVALGVRLAWVLFRTPSPDLLTWAVKLGFWALGVVVLGIPLAILGVFVANKLVILLMRFMSHSRPP